MAIDLNLPHLGPDTRYKNGTSGETVTRTVGIPVGGGNPSITLDYSGVTPDVERELDPANRLDARMIKALAGTTTSDAERAAARAAFIVIRDSSSIPAPERNALVTLFRYINRALEA